MSLKGPWVVLLQAQLDQDDHQGSGFICISQTKVLSIVVEITFGRS